MSGLLSVGYVEAEPEVAQLVEGIAGTETAAGAEAETEAEVEAHIYNCYLVCLELVENIVSPLLSSPRWIVLVKLA